MTLRKTLRLVRIYTTLSFRSQLQYKTSFFLLTLGTLLATGLEFAAVYALFSRFGSLHGWKLPQTALLYGCISVSFAIAEAAARGFDTFSRQIKSGSFDRILLRPLPPAFQIACSEIQLMRFGRFLQGLAVLGWAEWKLHLSGTALMMPLWMVTGGIALFYGVFVLQATLVFYTIETPEIVNIFTYGGVETAQYPLSIYPFWLRSIFTFLIPLASVSLIPARALLGTGSASLLSQAAPAAGYLFLIASLHIWKIGIAHYTSTGS